MEAIEKVVEKEQDSETLIKDLEKLLLKLIDDFGKESLVITVDQQAIYLSGSEKGKQFLLDKPDFANTFQQYCFAKEAEEAQEELDAESEIISLPPKKRRRKGSVLNFESVSVIKYKCQGSDSKTEYAEKKSKDTRSNDLRKQHEDGHPVKRKNTKSTRDKIIKNQTNNSSHTVDKKQKNSNKQISLEKKSHDKDHDYIDKRFEPESMIHSEDYNKDQNVERVERKLPSKVCCPTCFLKFGRQEKIENHIQLHHPDVWQKILSDGSDVLTYLRKQNQTSQKNVDKQVKEILEPFRKTSERRSSVRKCVVKKEENVMKERESELKKKKLGCKECPTLFCSRNSFRKHVRNFHPEKTPEELITTNLDYNKGFEVSNNTFRPVFIRKEVYHDCPDCDRKFQAVAHLNLHIYRAHGKGKPIKYKYFKHARNLFQSRRKRKQNKCRKKEVEDYCNKEEKLKTMDMDDTEDDVEVWSDFEDDSMDSDINSSSFIKDNLSTKENSIGKTMVNSKTFKEVDFVKGSEFKCYTCDEIFTSVDLLLEHMNEKGHRDLIEKMQNEGKKIFVTEKLNGSGKYVYTCSSCRRSYTLQEHSENHMKQMCRKIWLKYCPMKNCNLGFDNSNFFMNHMITFHNQEYPFPCLKCPRSFLKLSKFEIHQRFHARQEKEAEVTSSLTDIPLSFKSCCKGFSSDVALEKHVAEVHEQKNKTCEICGKKFLRQLHLSNHLKTHEKNQYPDFKCHLCGKVLLTQDGLTMHLKVTHSDNKPFICDICGYQSKQMSSLKFHINKKHKSGKPYVCTNDKCGAAFENYRQWQDHMQKHALREGNIPKAKSYGNLRQCNVCHEYLTVMVSIDKHVKKHSTEKKFVCSECGQVLKRKESLRTHMKNIHNSELGNDDQKYDQKILQMKNNLVIRKPKQKSRKISSVGIDVLSQTISQVTQGTPNFNVNSEAQEKFNEILGGKEKPVSILNDEERAGTSQQEGSSICEAQSQTSILNSSVETPEAVLEKRPQEVKVENRQQVVCLDPQDTAGNVQRVGSTIISAVKNSDGSITLQIK